MAKLGDILASVMQKRGYARPLQLGAFREAWKRVAGERLAANSRVTSYRDGTLTMEVGSSALRYELEAFRTPDLLAALDADDRVPRVRRIVFRVGNGWS